MAVSPEKDTGGALDISIKLNGKTIGDEVQVQSVRVSQDIGRIPHAAVTISSPAVLAEDFKELDSAAFNIGAKISIAAVCEGSSPQDLFDGIVVASRARMDPRQGLRLELTCRDKAVKLTGLRRSAQYQQKKDSDVMKQIISDAGLTADVKATAGDAADQLRYEASDWDYLRHLSDRNGHVLITHAGKISSGPPDTSAKAPLVVTFGVDQIEFDAEIDSQNMIKTASAQAWDEKTQKAVDGKAVSLPATTFSDLSSADIAKVLENREHRLSIAREFSAAELKSFADARLLRVALGAIQGRCKFQGSGKIKPGDMLDIADVAKRFSGKAYVSGVSHSIEAGSWTTETKLGLPKDWTTDAIGLAAPEAAGLNTPIPGVHIGKVLAIHDDPDAKQRIKLQLPILGDPAAEVWARYAQPYASKEAGLQFMPEVDDEVLVAFLGADPNAPIVIGSLHNDKAKQARPATEKNDIKAIVTREKLQVEFDDEKKIITVSTPGGHEIKLDDEGEALSLEDSHGNQITMDKSGITLKSTSDITIKADAGVDISATRDVTAKGNNVTCNGQVGFTGKGGATAELSSGGQTTVKGSMVMIN